MLDIILDIKCHIASSSEAVWFLMYLHDPEFHEYSKSCVGISEYKKNFNVCTRKDDRLIWRLFGRKHRENDLPAVMRMTTEGKFINPDRYKEPMVLYPQSWVGGYLEYYINGKTQREDDKPAIVHENGSHVYFYNGNHHRAPANGEDRPSIIHGDGTLEYHINGQLHRTKNEDGTLPPAIICSNGKSKYYENGVLMGEFQVVRYFKPCF